MESLRANSAGFLEQSSITLSYRKQQQGIPTRYHAMPPAQMLKLSDVSITPSSILGSHSLTDAARVPKLGAHSQTP